MCTESQYINKGISTKLSPDCLYHPEVNKCKIRGEAVETSVVASYVFAAIKWTYACFLLIAVI